jgi:hypothetical protein
VRDVRTGVPLAKRSKAGLYVPSRWVNPDKERYREWVWKKLSENARTIFGGNGKLRRGLSFVSLVGNEMEETRWFLEHHPFFRPEQLLAVDYWPEEGRGRISSEVARELGVPSENLFLDYPLKNVMQVLRVRHKVAVINADMTHAMTMESMRSEFAPLVVSLKRCYDRTGECFLFYNTAAEVINSAKIGRESKVVEKWLESRQVLTDYFDEPEYRDRDLLLPDWLSYPGTHKTTRMFCFCIHLRKGE